MYVAEEEDPFEFQKMLERSKTFSFESSSEIERRSDAKWIEPSKDAPKIDLSQVTETYKVQGFELKEPPKPKKGSEARALKNSDSTADYKRNHENYGVMCPTCHATGKCQVCRGRKRVRFLFKCKNCMGTGKCPDCMQELTIHCKKCGSPMKMYSDSCRKCGLAFTCPSCYSPLPALATKCIRCGNIFTCGSCEKPYPDAYSHRCPHCDHWNHPDRDRE